VKDYQLIGRLLLHLIHGNHLAQQNLSHYVDEFDHSNHHHHRLDHSDLELNFDAIL